MKSINSKTVHGITSRRHARNFNVIEPRLRLKPIGLRELPNWLLAMTFIFLSATDFKPVWLLDEPLEHFSQPADDGLALRLAKLNMNWLLKGAAHAAQIREEKICHPNSLLHKRQTPSATEAC